MDSHLNQNQHQQEQIAFLHGIVPEKLNATNEEERLKKWKQMLLEGGEYTVDSNQSTIPIMTRVNFH